MAEWPKAAASKAAILCKWNRGFESHSLLAQAALFKGLIFKKSKLDKHSAKYALRSSEGAK